MGCRWSTSIASKPNPQHNIPPILTLPPEVLECCWDYLRRPDLFQVSRVCRVFWHTSTFRMFQSLTINLSSSRVLHSTNQTPKTFESAKTRLVSFYSDPGARKLWNMVEAWTVTSPLVIRAGAFFPVHLGVHEQNLAPRFVDTFFQFLPCSRNLRSLELVCLDLRREQWVTLESLPALESLRLISCLLAPSSHLERPLKLKELEIAGGFSPCSIDEHVVSVLCNPAYLEKLTLIDSLVTHTVLLALSSMEYFPHLTYLNIIVKSFSRSHFLTFLSAIPSLMTLRIFPLSANITPDQPLPALSSFRSYNGYPHMLAHIVPGRPVDCVCLVLLAVTGSKDDDQPDDYAIRTDLVSSVLDISRSAVPVRRLTIEYFLPTLEHLTAIANYLPDLHYLDLMLISPPPPIPEDLDCASNLLDTLGTMGGLLCWLASGRAPLPHELQTLRLSYSPGWFQDMQSLEDIQQREIIHCLHGRYPSLREVELGDCRWWREGAHWSREILDPEES